MHKYFIMTAFGKDRVGIVADVTRLLFENDCSIEETTMNLLADQLHAEPAFFLQAGQH